MGLEILGYLLILAMGVTLGLLGGGGSILTVPILVYVFSINPVNATAYSLFIVGLVSGIGSITKFKNGQIDIKTGLVFAAPAFLGVFLARVYVVPSLPVQILQIGHFTLSKDALIMTIFAIMMILASFSMMKGRKSTEKKDININFLLIGIEGLVIGALTGFVGAGGGFLIIPALVYFAGLSMKKAVGTSLMIISIKSLFGFLGDVWVNPNIDWWFLLLLSTIATVGIFIGSYLVKLVPEQKLKFSFGVFVLIMGSFVLIKPFL